MAVSGICPACGKKVPEDSIWIYLGKFYCSEQCVASLIKRGF